MVKLLWVICDSASVHVRLIVDISPFLISVGLNVSNVHVGGVVSTVSTVTCLDVVLPAESLNHT